MTLTRTRTRHGRRALGKRSVSRTAVLSRLACMFAALLMPIAVLTLVGAIDRANVKEVDCLVLEATAHKSAPLGGQGIIVRTQNCGTLELSTGQSDGEAVRVAASLDSQEVYRFSVGSLSIKAAESSRGLLHGIAYDYSAK